jgi:hypothetical protein
VHRVVLLVSSASCKAPSARNHKVAISWTPVNMIFQMWTPDCSRRTDRSTVWCQGAHFHNVSTYHVWTFLTYSPGTCSGSYQWESMSTSLVS